MAIPTPVSYTHLDVYKRQVLDTEVFLETAGLALKEMDEDEKIALLIKACHIYQAVCFGPLPVTIAFWTNHSANSVGKNRCFIWTLIQTRSVVWV